LHVRRGDYTLKINEDLGVLSSDYFMGAVEKGRRESLLADSEIWVFSDSIDEAKKDFGDYGKNFSYIKSPASSSAAETMMLMASGQANIVSNSTFSYLGGSAKWTRQGYRTR
jgi:hypothetical protein